MRMHNSQLLQINSSWGAGCGFADRKAWRKWDEVYADKVNVTIFTSMQEGAGFSATRFADGGGLS